MEDARRSPDPDDALSAALVAAGFPSAERALEEPRLAALVAQFFAHPALVQWLGDGPPDMEPGFVLNWLGRSRTVPVRSSATNSIDRVEVVADGLVVEGTGRTILPGVAYQDV